ncbi:hypothetical protein CRX72_24615 [Pantoea sp. BRM17]|nr:hypothetical protein CRX72_24615 [Pantoea sp. BRM17]
MYCHPVTDVFFQRPVTFVVLNARYSHCLHVNIRHYLGNDSNLLIVFYVQIMPDDLVMQLHRF